VVASARLQPLDYVGPNLASSQVLLSTPRPVQGPPGSPPPSGRSPGGTPNGQAPNGKEFTRPATAAWTATARGIAAELGTSDLITLEQANVGLQRVQSSGRNWGGSIYVATPQLLRAFGITASQVSPTADILTVRPGLSSLSNMQFTYGTLPCSSSAAGCPQGPGGAGTVPCVKGHCVANPVIQELSALPSGTSAPNTLVTEHAIRQLGLGSTITTTGWLIQAAQPLTASQVHSAQQAAAAAGMTIETHDSFPSLTEIINEATVFGILLALGILGMAVGLVRSETAGDLRTLAATGASSGARRTITAATAGGLALAGAVTGIFCGYLAAIGFFRTNQLDGLSTLGSIPVANLLLICVGMPLVAVIVGWLLAGRQPPAIGRQPME
jgi:putative ABC transport system permease protein